MISSLEGLLKEGTAYFDGVVDILAATCLSSKAALTIIRDHPYVLRIFPSFSRYFTLMKREIIKEKTLENPSRSALTFLQNISSITAEGTTLIIQDQPFVQALVKKDFPDKYEYDKFWTFIFNLALHPGKLILKALARILMAFGLDAKTYLPVHDIISKISTDKWYKFFFLATLGSEEDLVSLKLVL